jgi:hypothetical protein
MPLCWGWNRWMAHQWVMSVANDGRYGRVFMEYYHMRKHIRHIADADGRNEFVGNQNPAVEFPPTLPTVALEKNIFAAFFQSPVFSTVRGPTLCFLSSLTHEMSGLCVSEHRSLILPTLIHSHPLLSQIAFMRTKTMDLEFGRFIPISCFSMEACSMGMFYFPSWRSMIFGFHNCGSYDDLNSP